MRPLPSDDRRVATLAQRCMKRIMHAPDFRRGEWSPLMSPSHAPGRYPEWPNDPAVAARNTAVAYTALLVFLLQGRLLRDPEAAQDARFRAALVQPAFLREGARRLREAPLTRPAWRTHIRPHWRALADALGASDAVTF